MLPSLGPVVQAWPLPARVAAYTAMWAAHCFIVQLAIAGIGSLLLRAKLMKKNTRDPQTPLLKVALADAWGFCGDLFGVAIVHALVNPSWDDWSFGANLVGVFWYQVPYMIFFDAWYFWLHYLCHKNKFLFRHVHALHHDSKAILGVSTTSYLTWTEGFVFVGIPMGGLAALAWRVFGKSWWHLFVPVHTTMSIVIMGHCGWDLKLDNLVPDALFLLVNPFMAVQLCTANHATPIEHETHHLRPMTNFAPFFTFWDDLMGFSYPKEPITPFSIMALNLSYFAVLWSFVCLLIWQPAIFAAVLAAHLLTPLPLVEKLLGRASRAAQRLALWDFMRRQYGVEFAPPGAPGAFEPAAAAASVARQAAAELAKGPKGGDFLLSQPSFLPQSSFVLSTGTHALPSCASGGSAISAFSGPSSPGVLSPAPSVDLDRDGSPSIPSSPSAPASPLVAAQLPPAGAGQRFVFGYHPQGFLARGALHTFAAAGRESPVSRLPGGCKLAVGSGVLRVPAMQQALLLGGCTDASYANLKRRLTVPDGGSVAISPGGWREAHRMGTYELVLRRRLGFIKLAAEAGAALVPVLGVGEPEVTGPAGIGALYLRWLKCYRPRPLKVVFGEPVAPLAGEPLAATQERYIASLNALAAAHGVKLVVAE